jgi:hypothetical protein
MGPLAERWVSFYKIDSFARAGMKKPGAAAGRLTQ